MARRESNNNRSVRTIIIGVLVILAGMGGFFYVLFSGLSEMSADLRRFVVPGSLDMKVDGPAKFTIFHEYRSRLNGKNYNVRSIPTLEITVTRDGLEEIPTSAPSGSSKYSINSYSGYTYRTFRLKNQVITVLWHLIALMTKAL